MAGRGLGRAAEVEGRHAGGTIQGDKAHHPGREKPQAGGRGGGLWWTLRMYFAALWGIGFCGLGLQRSPLRGHGIGGWARTLGVQPT